MKRLLPLVAAAVASFAAACGSSYSPPVLPPPVRMYSNASLNGQYAFSMSGQDGLTGAPVSRVGSFIADGAGNILGAIEDALNLANPSPLNFVNFGTGTYSIVGDGRGTLVLGSGTTSLVLSITLTSASQGLMIQTDLNSTSSGSFIKQTPGAFSASSFNGGYVFDVSGVSVTLGGNAAPLSIMGQLKADGAGSITGGVLDENDGNHPAPSGVINSGVGGNYQMDAMFGSNFGRGLFTVSYKAYNTTITRTFAFYIVDGTRIKWMEEDSLAASLGDAVQQSSAIATSNSGFTGSYVYLVGGANTTGSLGPLTRVARFTADGGGSLTSVAFDENDNGTHSANSGISNAQYSIDIANAGSGRGTLTFTDSVLGNFDAIFYQISPTKAVIQDLTAGSVTDGSLLAQSAGPSTNAALAGNYAFNWSGIILPTSSFTESEEDFVGQYALSNTGNVNGALDYVQLGFIGNPVHLDTPLTGAYTIKTDGTAANTAQFVIQTSPNSTLNFAAYIVNSNTTFFVVTDNNVRVTAGTAILQH